MQKVIHPPLSLCISKTHESHNGESKFRADAIQHASMRCPAWKGDLVRSSLQMPLDINAVRRSKTADGILEELEGFGITGNARYSSCLDLIYTKKR